jgi:hypothetical protein
LVHGRNGDPRIYSLATGVSRFDDKKWRRTDKYTDSFASLNAVGETNSRSAWTTVHSVSPQVPNATTSRFAPEPRQRQAVKTVLAVQGTGEDSSKASCGIVVMGFARGDVRDREAQVP